MGGGGFDDCKFLRAEMSLHALFLFVTGVWDTGSGYATLMRGVPANMRMALPGMGVGSA